MEDLSRSLVRALIDAAPGHNAGTRPVHAFGVGATGWFRGSGSAPHYCRAAHFRRSWTPATIRFSDGNGFEAPDLTPQVRGMAVKFDPGTPRETDLISMSIPIFVAKTPGDTLRYAPATKPQTVVRPKWHQRLWALAQLCPLPPDVPGTKESPAQGLLKMSDEYRPAQAGVFAMGLMRPPISFVRQAYYAVHAFNVEGDDRTHRFVRFTWEPLGGSRGVDERPESLARLGDSYLRTELAGHLEKGPAQFGLRMQISDPFDDTSDPTVAWPTSRTRVYMGTLLIDKVVADQDAQCDRLSFNPGRLIEGIALSDDPILHSRVAAYEESCKLRHGSGCPMVGP